MRTYLVAFVLSLFSGLVFTRLLRDLALRLDLTDAGGGRKIHRRPIPRLGGVAVAISLALPLMGLAFWRNDISRELAADLPLLGSLACGGGLLFAVGLWDDLRDARAIYKLVAQVLAAAIVYAWGIRIEAVSVPFLHPVHLGWLSPVATIFWIVLVTNAVNLIDGMDGLAGGVVVLAGGTLFIMSVIEDNALAALLLACVVGATLGFLAYNVNPASIFLGDTGSLLLGFLLALVSVHSSQKSYTLFSIIAAMLALGLPIFDLSLAVVRRLLSGQPVFSADQHHVHHRLLRMGLSQSQSVAVLFAGAIVLEGLALVFIYADDALSAVAIGALVPLIIVVVRMLGYDTLIRSARRARLLEQVERDAADRTAAVARARQALHAVDSMAALWAEVEGAAEAAGFERVELELADPAFAAEGPLRWTRPGAAAAEVHLSSVWTRSAAVGSGPRSLGRLRVDGHAERQVLAPLDAALVQLLADGVCDGLLRLEARRAAGPAPTT
jgi:UDP-GlcNAc:undecaprenyl-phosphate GlcNAc-1-phosphate transferase